MGIPTNIKTLLSGSVVEWARIEFKENWDAATSLKTICAFANDIDNWGGGYIVIGVKAYDGQPVSTLEGLPATHIDRTLKDMLNKCKLIQPEYLPIVEVVEYQGKMFLIVWAPGGSSRPYSSPKSMAKGNKERAYYIRKMSSTVIPSEDELRDLFSLSNNIPFDDRINHEAELIDLNITLIQSYLKEIGSSLFNASKTLDFADLCKSMNIVGTLPEYTKPKNVGLMFFSFEPDRFFPYAQIDVVEFPEGLGGDRIIENTFKGPLHIQLKEALLHIQNRVIQEQVIKRPDVAEAKRFFNYPYAAIEESLANAVYHKGYDEREPIEVRILPDRIEIVSHPGADRSVSIEGLQNYKVFSRRYRNRRIGEFLKELQLTEGRNTGFSKIINALEHNGSPLPIFETDDDRLSFAVTIYQHPEFTGRGVINGVENGVDGVENGVEKYFTESESKVLACISEVPSISKKSISEKTGISARTVDRIISDLKKRKVIERQGPDRGGVWVILG